MKKTLAMKKTLVLLSLLLLMPFPLAAQRAKTRRDAARPARFDIIIRNGTVYDGTGGEGRRADVGIRGDRIAAVGDLSGAAFGEEVDVRGLAVAPGFINMLSWSTESLIVDGRSLGELKQGVTTQIMGEGESMGPLSPEMKRQALAHQGDIKYPIEWTTLSDYLKYLERRGVSQNVASFVGATTVREYILGDKDVQPSPAQMRRMKELVRREMEAGALGVGSSIIYPPAVYAKTEELIEMCKVAARYKGKYISHMRSEGTRLVEAVEELIRISREAGLPAEIYHLKAAGTQNWSKMDRVIELVNDARRQGLKITADMYTYPAGATGLSASLPPWVADKGEEEFYRRLQDPAMRARIAEEVRTPSDKWENLYVAAGSPDRVLLVGFRSAELKPMIGKSLGEVARMRGKSPEETIMDLIVEDHSRVETIYFMMSEENIKKQFREPWVSLGSDAESQAPEGVFLKNNPHPRAYGNFARFLGHYVREEKIMPLGEAIRRLSGLPATNLGLSGRGFLQPGMFADVVVFDPATIADRATFAQPHQFSVGVKHVFVNGVQVLRDGGHTGAKPGRALWGAGKIKGK
jgi:N-acyl-D-amino-acid deacylase